MNSDMGRTMKFSPEKDQDVEIREILTAVYEALKSKGYNPVNQMTGYLLSGDPTYITSHNNARSLIRKVERDDLVEALLNYFMAAETEK